MRSEGGATERGEALGGWRLVRGDGSMLLLCRLRKVQEVAKLDGWFVETRLSRVLAQRRLISFAEEERRVGCIVLWRKALASSPRLLSTDLTLI